MTSKTAFFVDPLIMQIAFIDREEMVLLLCKNKKASSKNEHLS